MIPLRLPDAGGKGNGELFHNAYRVSVWSDKKVWKNGSNGYTTL